MSIDNSIFSEIPEANLKKWPSFTVFVSTLLIQITSLMFGFNLRLLTDFQTFILAIIFADFILFGLFFVSGYVGMKKRLPTATLYSRIFGNLGCKIVMLLMLPIGLIWMAWMTEMVANSLLGLYPSLNYLYLVILIISVSVLSSIKDIKGMEISSYIQVPIVLLMIITACIRLFVNGVKVADICPLEKINLYQSVSYVLLTWINFLPFYSDYTRFVKSKKDLTLSTGICWGIIYSLVMIAGGLFASCGGNNFDLIKVLRIAGIPVFVAVIIMFLCTWTFNDRSLYAYSIAINFIAGKEKYKKIFIIIGGAVAVVLAYFGINNRILTILNGIGAIFVPLLAVFIHFFYVSSINRSEEERERHLFNYQPFISWLFGVLIGCLTNNKLILSFVASFTMCYLFDKLAPFKLAKREIKG